MGPAAAGVSFTYAFGTITTDSAAARAAPAEMVWCTLSPYFADRPWSAATSCGTLLIDTSPSDTSTPVNSLPPAPAGAVISAATHNVRI